MPNYRRAYIAGGTYFITQVTYQRQPWLCSKITRTALRTAIETVRQQYPFSIDAFVLLPDHFHCIWTLPSGDSDYSTRLRLIKGYVTKQCGNHLDLPPVVSASRQKRGEQNLWQRRFWEHVIRDEDDFTQHCDYIHYNPVAHGLCQVPQQWEFSSLHRLIVEGMYTADWGMDGKGVEPLSWDGGE
ncbi:MAG: transposase [Symplocastrum torsivum CPER-KK1]|jgi:putative transposase|uniref:Transposase n=1 Tax=Symplocastrum torsivum CPER-KK1 TaxID=450513 RepID=A0A951PP36_9CYAN|nr:transposase [Symplocastrum torsivum CPER-KK1]